MKKSVGFAIVFMMLSLVSLPFAIVMVDGGKEEIIITREILSGDPAAAEGIILQTAACWDGHLFWNTVYAAESGKEAESSFTFASRHVSWDLVPIKSAVLRPEGGAGFGSAFTDAAAVVNPDNLPFSEIIKAVAEKAAAGETYSCQMRIGDYYEYYPLVLDLEGVSVIYEGDYMEVCGWLSDFFHIPTAEDRFDVIVEKDFGGQLVSVSAGVDQGEQQTDITGVSAFGEDGFYFTFCLQDMDIGEGVDRGQNKGIFFFPWEQEKQDIFHLDLTQVRKACEYPGEGVPLQMLLEEEEGRIYLTVREQEEYWLWVYEIEEDRLVPVQKLSVGKCSFDFCQMLLGEEGILFTWDNNEFSFAVREEEGFRLWCSGEFPRDPEKTRIGGNPFPRENVCLFDGERLVLAAFEDWFEMNVLLAVYDGSGMVYSGLYYNGGKPDPEIPFAMSACGIVPQGPRLWKPDSIWEAGNSNDIRPLKVYFHTQKD
ncbi:MAG: hypothetical protein K2O06_00630 [Acetatifactor sp.]|nr:hypothetical protein [Acetatifactor sp.]